MEETLKLTPRVKELTNSLPYKPSKYQINIWNEIDKGEGNLMINAVAGSGKTSVIVEGVNLISSNKKTAFCAFNKAIAEELKDKVPSNVVAKTMHSIGMGIILRKGKVKLDIYKYDNIIKDKLKEWDWEEDWDYQCCIKKLVDLARYNLISNPEELREEGDRHGLPYIDNMEVARALECLKIGDVLARSIIDFTDMIYLPVKYKDKYNWNFSKFDNLFVDEVQDLNKVQQKLVGLLLKKEGRLIAVGDPFQCIFGFAGADVRSFDRMKEAFKAKVMPLSVNYRCGKKSKELVEHIVPHYEVYEKAIQGEISYSCNIDDVSSGDFILCRTTSPLIKLCFKYIAQKRKAFVKGRDLGKHLVKLIKKAETKDIKVLQVFLTIYKAEKIDKIKQRNPNLTKKEIEKMPFLAIIQDNIDVINLIIDNSETETVIELIEIIDSIFLDKAPGICLSTIHRVKGLEANNVYILKENTLGSKHPRYEDILEWEQEQEMNLVYVAYTRWKKKLGFLKDEEDEKD